MLPRGWRKVERLDTLSYVQDLTLGSSIGATVGARWRDEERRDAEVQPEASLSANHANELVDDLFTHLTLRGGLRWNGDEAAGWNASAAARTFALLTMHDTLGASIAFDAVEEHQDLPIEVIVDLTVALEPLKTRKKLSRYYSETSSRENP